MSFSLDTNINCPLKDNMSQGRNLEGALGLPFTSLSTVDLLKMGCLLRMDCLAGMLKCFSCGLLYCTSGTASFTGMNTFAALDGTWKSHLTMSSVCCSHRNCYLSWYPKSYFRGTCVRICQGILNNPQDIFSFYNSCLVKSGTYYYE